MFIFTGQITKTACMKDLKKLLYHKVLALIPVLETAKPLDDFWIGNGEEGANVNVRGFNFNPFEKIGVEIIRSIPNEVHRDKNGIYHLLKQGYRNAPKILFELKRNVEEVDVFAIFDERPQTYCDQVKLLADGNGILLETGREKQLQEKLDHYIDEFTLLGYQVEP